MKPPAWKPRHWKLEQRPITTLSTRSGSRAGRRTTAIEGSGGVGHSGELATIARISGQLESMNGCGY